MTRSIALLCAAFVFASCSTPRPQPKGAEAVLSGEETAKTAADAARAAEASGNTGILNATSKREEAASQPEPTTQPAEKAPIAELEPTIEIALIKGVPTINGEPISKLQETLRTALAPTTHKVVRISVDADTPYKTVVDLMDAVRTAGGEPVLAPPADGDAAAEK